MTTEQAVPHLTTGWEPDLEPHDTELRRFVLAWGQSLGGPVTALGGQVVRTADAVTCDLGRPGSYYSAAVVLRPPSPDRWDQVLDEVERTMFRRGSGPVHLYSAWPTPDLSARDWRLEGHPPFLLRPPGGPRPEPAPDLEVREVSDADELRTWERVVVEGYPLPDLQPWRPGSFFTDEVLACGLRLWVGRAGGEPVAAAASYVAHGLHVLAVGVVLPHARGRGYWRTLLATRLEAFPELPCGSLFSDMSRPGAQRHGFLPISRFTLWVRDRE
jgi:GNAT superfamily N-acetyltransferase